MPQVTQIGYAGFESPMNLYSPNATLPVVYTGGYQVRQFGVGAANTLGAGVQPCNVLGGLYSPPDAKMTTANTHSLTHAAALYVVTKADIDNYQVAGTTNA